MKYLKWRWLLAALLMVGPLMAQPSLGKDDLACLECHGQADFSKTGADGKTLSLFVDAQKFADSMHGALGCTGCHADVSLSTHPDKAPAPVNCVQCHEKADATYKASIHGQLRKAGNLKAANCRDCHGAHDIGPMNDSKSPLSRKNLEDTCGKCHAQIVAEVKESVHGQALARGVREAPSCIDCHGDHRVEDLRAVGSLKVSQQVCSRCHGSQRMNEKFDMPANRVSTFFDSYHGLASRMGSASAANCASCHGFHGVFPSSDPRSTVHPSNMVATCSRCHPGANENFIQGRIHVDDKTLTDTGSKAIHWVRMMYVSLIFATIGGMLLHNLLAFRRHLLKSLRDPNRNLMRMSRLERWLHGLLMLSFTYLAISGFALRFPGSWLTLAVGSSETIRRLGHRAAAIVLMGIALAYFIHVVFTKEGRQMVIDMLPRRHDLDHFMENIRHYLHLEAARPKFTRYWYAEKAEYWALIWGTIIMGLTGSLIWFKMFFTHWLPRWVIEVSIAVHFYEAVLACLAIFVWHFYFVIFDPEIYPMNWAWLDGKVTDDHHAAHLHKAETAEEDDEGEPPPED